MCQRIGACTWFPALFAHLWFFSLQNLGLLTRLECSITSREFEMLKWEQTVFLYCIVFFLFFFKKKKQEKPDQCSVCSLPLCVPVLTRSALWEEAVPVASAHWGLVVVLRGQPPAAAPPGRAKPPQVSVPRPQAWGPRASPPRSVLPRAVPRAPAQLPREGWEVTFRTVLLSSFFLSSSLPSDPK